MYAMRGLMSQFFATPNPFSIVEITCLNQIYIECWVVVCGGGVHNDPTVDLQ